MKSRRQFLKQAVIASVISRIPFSGEPEFLTSVATDKMIGLRFFQGCCEFEIFKKAPARFTWKGASINNQRMNKFFARNFRKGKRKSVILLALSPVRNGTDWDFSRYDLGKERFFKPA